MSRIDTVYEALRKIDDNSGADAGTIAKLLGISRSNASFFLNRLVDEGKVEKISIHRPVKYRIAVNNSNYDMQQELDLFVEMNPSMKNAVIQAKSAVLYPSPNMHILIIGETGVGKSMFAEMIFRYALNSSVIKNDAPFIVFNCADYANNPQLLLAQLFGAKKGSYTGADKDSQGLIEAANGGILFLDEVHRLPPEGQEMFFTFMDRGTFRRLGEANKEHKSSVRIIAATSENPESKLLQTFIRRIPVMIKIPNLSQRSFEERFHLISTFFQEESSNLKRQIKVSKNAMRALLTYDCPNNLGQLKTDIQLLCARAYLDFISRNVPDILITSQKLPENIKSALYGEMIHREIWNSSININEDFYIYDPSVKKQNINIADDAIRKNIYNLIDAKLYEANIKGFNIEEIQLTISKEIENYFTLYHGQLNSLDTQCLSNVIGENIYKITRDVVIFAEDKLNRKLSERMVFSLGLHIYNLHERLKENKIIVNSNLSTIKKNYPKEFEVSSKVLTLLEKAFDLSIPLDEAGFIAMFFILNDNTPIKNNVAVIVIAHGESTATSLANTANKLLNTNCIIGIDAKLDESVQKVLERLKSYLIKESISEALLLVDMGSLTSFGKEIELLMDIKIKVLPLVSTLHVLEAARKALMGCSLEEVFSSAKQVNKLMPSTQTEEIYSLSYEDEKLVIVTMCTTGKGSAETVNRILKEKLIFDEEIVSILSLELNSEKEALLKLRNIEKNARICYILAPFSLNTPIPQFDFSYAFSDSKISTLQEIIDLEQTYAKMSIPLKGQFKNAKDKQLLLNVKYFIRNIEDKMDYRMRPEHLIGLVLHICATIDRLVGKEYINSNVNKKHLKAKNPLLFDIVSNETKMLEQLYGIEIPEAEILNIIQYFMMSQS
ncbi:sigma 54-interacting transcriptional regulator [Tepidanaerobacter syntrophicus]|uniref:sigma 54-interacting transcriptional regulator n=1 Tax=Tepidanaerobacter syntrophicus TaxID=224999 RepID=UPI001BD2A231|nr:sigma 54-interacting transcriptional regulator [Tepidanaerobacter syntrophicus]